MLNPLSSSELTADATLTSSSAAALAGTTVKSSAVEPAKDQATASVERDGRNVVPAELKLSNEADPFEPVVERESDRELSSVSVGDGLSGVNKELAAERIDGPSDGRPSVEAGPDQKIETVEIVSLTRFERDV